MAHDAHTPTLLGLPTELLIIVAEHLPLAEGICNLRSTCYDIAMRIQDEFASRVALPITMDDEGCQTLEYAITSNNARLPPLAPQITRIRLADLGHMTSAIAYCRNVDVESLQKIGTLTHYIDKNEEVIYHGYRQHGPCLEWTEAMPFMELMIDNEGVTKIAQLLPKFPKLSTTGTFMRRTELHLLYNSEYPFVIKNDKLFGAAEWFGSMGPPKDDWSREYRLQEWKVHYSLDSHLDLLYSSAFVRPAAFDLQTLDTAFAKASQLTFSETLTRLSITSDGGLHLKSMQDGFYSLKRDLVAFVRGCTNLERLHVRLQQRASWCDELMDILEGNTLPRLSHLKVEGVPQLEFFFFKPLSWECSAFNEEQLEPLTRTIQQSPHVVIDFGGFGFEQGVDGRGFEKLAERIKWREQIMEKWFQVPLRMMCVSVNHDLDEELRGRIGYLADGRDDDPGRQLRRRRRLQTGVENSSRNSRVLISIEELETAD